jgi:hypothetical protein
MHRINTSNNDVARSGLRLCTLSSRSATAPGSLGWACGLLLGWSSGCHTEYPAPVQGNTETDGVVTTGVDGAGGEGADETGAEVPYYCIYNTDNPMGLVGVKHQCGLEYDLEITFTVAPPVGSSFQVPLAVDAVQTVSDDSTYEHPFVMACCTDVTTHADWPFEDSCDYLHHKACLSDFIEHICDAPGVWLEKAAQDHVGQGAEAIEAAADWFKSHRNDCYDHFWTGPDALYTADLCSEDFVGFFDHTPWEPGLTWAYVEPITGLTLAEVSDVIVAPRSSLDQVTPKAPPSPAESCELPNSNNGETPPFSLPSTSGSVGSLVAPVSIDVVGPALAQEPITGFGELGTDSVLRWHTSNSNALELERWSMIEDAPTTVGTSSITASVDHFKLDLLGPHSAVEIPRGWQLGAGAALFNLIATVDGEGSNVQATNATPIKLHIVNGGVGACPTHVGSCLVSRPFTIGYEDTLGHAWELDIPTTTWTP